MESKEMDTEIKLSFAFESIIAKNQKKIGKEFVLYMSEEEQEMFNLSLLRLKLRKEKQRTKQLCEKLGIKR